MSFSVLFVWKWTLGQEEKKKEKIGLSIGAEYGYTRPISKEPHGYFFYYLHNAGLSLDATFFRYISIKTGLRFHNCKARWRGPLNNFYFDTYGEPIGMEIKQFFTQSGIFVKIPLFIENVCLSIGFKYFIAINSIRNLILLIRL